MINYSLDGYWRVAISYGARYDFSSLCKPFREALPTLIQTLPSKIIKEMQFAQQESVNIPFLTLADKGYPADLKKIPFAPPVLFYKGNLDQLKRPMVAIVGTRHCSSRAQNITASFASALSRKATIVSGLAYGVDQTAHLNALPYTIGICGQGLGTTISGYRRLLYKKIIDNGGLLLSEFHPSQPPQKWTYVQRNRSIAGLVDKLIVTEAPLRSGALISANHAINLGKEVYAIPSHPYHQAGLGSLKLLQDGALFAVQPRDIFDDLTVRNSDNALLQYLNQQRTIEDIIRNSSTSPQEIQKCLMELLSQGLISQEGPYWQAKPLT